MQNSWNVILTNENFNSLLICLCFLSHHPSSAGCSGMLLNSPQGSRRNLYFEKKNMQIAKVKSKTVQRSNEVKWMKERRPESSRVQFLVVAIMWTQPGSQSSLGSSQCKKIGKDGTLALEVYDMHLCVSLFEWTTHPFELRSLQRQQLSWEMCLALLSS